jgi:soluble lytic murein transglycosylase-like protein
MVILPVDFSPGRPDLGASVESRPAEGNDFARIFAASVEKGKTAGGTSEKVAAEAEILRLEMMKSAVSFSVTDQDPSTTTVSNALKAFLTQNAIESQKTDTSESMSSLPTEITDASTPQQTTASGDLSPRAGLPASSFDAIIKNAANRYGVQEGLIKAVIKMESDFNPKAVSHAGAQGLMQLMPSTAAGLGVKDAFDPEQNIMAGTRFLRDLLNRYGGDLDSTLAAYNWGPGNVDRSHGAFLPRETREYLAKVKKYYSQFVG